MTDWDTILKQRPISEGYNINPPNFMNIYESLAFMHNKNLEMQKKILEKLEKIEKVLEGKMIIDEEIEQLKIKIKKGENFAKAIKNDSTCSEGFEAARKLIEYYGNELSRYMRIAAVYEDLLVLSNKIKAEANKK